MILKCTPKDRQYDKLFKGRGAFFMPKGVPNKRHTGEFKQQVIEYILEKGVSCHEAGRIFDTDHKNVELWERIYLSEGMEGLYQERRGRKGKGLPKNVHEDLLVENQRL